MHFRPVGEASLDYLTGWRIYRAKMLPISTDESLPRIASMVRYGNDLSLSRVFKRRTGMAPGRWRQMIKKGVAPAPSDAGAVPELEVA